MQEVGPQEVGLRREALGVGAVDVRQPPHSTFKIWNTLIALETGAAPDAGFQQRYDPVKYPRDRTGGRRPGCRTRRWRAHSGARRCGITGSWPFVWGRRRCKPRLSRLGYGNADISSGLDSFWLGGGLDFPREQVALLARLARGEVPFSPEHVATLRRIMVLDQGEGWTLSGKTGLGELGQAGSGPVRGPVRGLVRGAGGAGGPDLRFATYLHGRDMKTFGPHRIALTRRALALLGVLPSTG